MDVWIFLLTEFLLFHVGVVGNGIFSWLFLKQKYLLQNGRKPPGQTFHGECPVTKLVMYNHRRFRRPLAPDISTDGLSQKDADNKT
ncbi:hypothetical protein CEXT_523231 [Caerostris extrusa]|uniref:Uncharacterized protein n=1 Tax=Caerostris extrusa TaxID=172846 RepID=A0AAV4RQN7_CAEEX|nr:hypothetical protein CEXT_523231 [Caerostris extrusa]